LPESGVTALGGEERLQIDYTPVGVGSSLNFTPVGGVFDPDTFVQEIQPRLGTVSVVAMMRATGLSRPYCTMIRRGEYVPHPRHRSSESYGTSF